MNERLNIYRHGRVIEDERRRLDVSSIDAVTKKTVKQYQDHLLAKNVCEYRVARLGMGLRKLAESLGKPYEEATKEDLQRLVAEINRNPHLRPATQSDYKQILKQFYKWLKGNDESFPPEVKWLSVAIKRKDRKQFNELIHPDEARTLVHCCPNLRDKAFIAFLYETGARIDEVLNMRIKDFKLEEQWAKVRLCGKTGERWITVVSSVPHVDRYLQGHPLKADLDAFIWLSEGSYRHQEPLLYIGATKIIRRAFRAAGLKKRCHAHLFRHSRATELAKDLTEVQMCLYFGWVLGTRQVSTYVHASGREVDDAIKRLHGVDVKKEENSKPMTCFRCGTSNTQGTFCKSCGYALSASTAFKQEQETKTEMDKTFQLLLEISKNPSLLKEYEEFRKKALQNGEQPSAPAPSE